MVRSAGLQKAISEAIWGMVIADAIAMPVHWFYQIDEIKRRYNGWIQGKEGVYKVERYLISPPPPVFHSLSKGI